MVIKRERQIINKNEKKERSKFTQKKLCTSFILGILCFSLLLFMVLADPVLMMIKAYTRVTNGSFVHELMLQEMEGIHISAYLFNITNPEEFISGDDEKLKVEEVGPFTYREMRSNLDIEIDTEAQRLRYTPGIRLEYVTEESIGRPEDVNVTAPNIPMLGLATMANQMSYWAGIGFNLLTTQVNSKPIVTLDAGNYLWGYEEPLISLAHTVIPGQVHFDKMGILDRIYDKKNLNRLEVSIANEDKFMIKKLNGFSKLKMGDTPNPDECELCNTLENSYEGVGFPFGLTPEFPLRIFRNGLCRILDMDYFDFKPTEYGSDALVYHFNDNFFTLNPNETGNGVLALPECFFGVPLAFSKPHFLDSDPSVYEQIEGLEPDDKHRGWVTIDAKFSITLETVFSIQLNLVVGDVSSNSKAKRFSNMVLPICYLKIVQPPLPKESTDFLTAAYVTGPYVMLGIQIVLLMLTVSSWGYFLRAVYLNYILKDDTKMSFPLGTTIKEINANNVEEPLMIDTNKAES